MTKSQEIKEKILDSLDNKTPINTIEEAIKFLGEKDNLIVEKQSKYKVYSKGYTDNFEAEFYFDKELIEWAKEERDKIEEAKNETENN